MLQRRRDNGGLARAFFIFFKSINESGDHKMSPSINGLTEADDAIATIGLD
jgi:hypothetical protein